MTAWPAPIHIISLVHKTTIWSPLLNAPALWDAQTSIPGPLGHTHTTIHHICWTTLLGQQRTGPHLIWICTVSTTSWSDHLTSSSSMTGSTRQWVSDDAELQRPYPIGSHVHGTHLLDVTSHRFPHHLHLLVHRHNANTLDVLVQQVKPNPHSTGKITTLPHAKCYLPWCFRRLSRACPSLLGDKHPWPSGPNHTTIHNIC